VLDYRNLKMHFINLELLNTKDFKERFDLQKFVGLTEDVYDYLDSYFIDKVAKLPVYGTTFVQIEEARPDLVSYRLYKTTQFWYILMLYNGMVSPFDLVEGQELKYPRIEDIEELYFSLNALQRKNVIQKE
jgi:hypothetical protein